jgi:hypothetical protein
LQHDPLLFVPPVDRAGLFNIGSSAPRASGLAARERKAEAARILVFGRADKRDCRGVGYSRRLGDPTEQA